MLATANNLVALEVSPSRSDFLGCSIGQINNLVLDISTVMGHIMALATVGSRPVWLGLTAVLKSRVDLLGVPVSPQSLFVSIFSLAQHLKRLEEKSTQISCPLSIPRKVVMGREDTTLQQGEEHHPAIVPALRSMLRMLDRV